MTEVWKDIEGYEGVYQVSNFGQIKSLRRKIHNYIKDDRILKPTIHKRDVVIGLCKERKTKIYNIWKLVATAFIPNPNKYKKIKFIDGDRMNVCATNLEWVNSKELEVNNLVGKKFGFLTLIGDKKRIGKQIRYKCICDCGNIYYATLSGLVSEHNKSCGKCKLAYTNRNSKGVENLTGKKFGRLTVLELYGRDKYGRARWLCECECGKKTICNAGNLKTGTTKSCGCIKKLKTRRKDLSGKKFGKLTVQNYYGTLNGKALWHCICDCGNEINLSSFDLTYERVHSCGCNNSLSTQERLKKMQWGNDNKIIFGECAKCGSKEKLNSHHIFPRNVFPNLKYNYANGITLCDKCHKFFHHNYGNKCGVRDLVEYLELNPICSNIIDMVINYKSKQGKEDLLKARHYIDMLIEFEYGEETEENNNEQ